MLKIQHYLVRFDIANRRAPMKENGPAATTAPSQRKMLGHHKAGGVDYEALEDVNGYIERGGGR